MIAVERIYFDANVFVALVEEDGITHDLLQKIAEACADLKEGFIVTSALTISELLVRPFRIQNDVLASIYRSWFDPGGWFEIAEVDRLILENAAVLRSQRLGLKTPDAVHLASAISSGCSHFLTADMKLRDIDELNHPITGSIDMKSLTILRPDEPTLSAILETLAA